jgi:hypothetical protein
MKGCLLSLLICCSCCASNAQDSIIRSAGLNFIYHPYDFFSGVYFARQKYRLEQRVFFNVGVNRTFFQRRFNPQTGYQLGYAVINRKWLYAGPFAKTVLSAGRINKLSDHAMVYNEEVFAGLFAGLGKRNRLILSGGVGPAWEQNWSTLENRYQSWFSWNYFLEIGYSYAF